MRRPAGPLLQAAAQLVRQFPQNRDVVVSVARKTDAQMWPALFAAVGVPSSMLDSLLEAGMLQSAACCLLIVDRIEGPQAAHGRALQLIQVSEAGLKLSSSWLLAPLEPLGHLLRLPRLPPRRVTACCCMAR